ncbi:MAG: hypothetical protein CVU86_04030 [Firmicutes bacterium HGW-Firmicutes-11]|jgi:hypothetical protein|nr:MAG: hypothetical protein CVU86_04030 [Firmicutes bacterium HGW-Firmicutes-11]
MKNFKIQDERIVTQKRKIGSDAFGIVYFGLIASILLQQFMFDAPFSQYAAEFIFVMIAAIYVVSRNIIAGNNLFTETFKGQKIVVLNSIVCGVTIAVITTALNTTNLGLEQMGGATGIAMATLITFACGAIVAFIGFELLYIINKKRQDQMDAKYIDSDE